MRVGLTALLLLLLFLAVSPSDFSGVRATESGDEARDLQLVRTKMHLVGKFDCQHQVPQCFENRFARCFGDSADASSVWFDSSAYRVSVYKFFLPAAAANLSQAAHVTVLMQLLRRSDNAPVRETTMKLVGTPVNKCAGVGFEGGFVLLVPWQEPEPPGEVLSENWIGVLLSVVFAAVPVAVVSLNVYRRWKKIARSDRAYVKLLRMQAEERRDAARAHKKAQRVAAEEQAKQEQAQELLLRGDHEGNGGTADADIEMVEKTSSSGSSSSRPSAEAAAEVAAASAAVATSEGPHPDGHAHDPRFADI